MRRTARPCPGQDVRGQAQQLVPNTGPAQYQGQHGGQEEAHLASDEAIWEARAEEQAGMAGVREAATGRL